jgi:hypothetical protein
LPYWGTQWFVLAATLYYLPQAKNALAMVDLLQSVHQKLVIGEHQTQMPFASDQLES